MAEITTGQVREALRNQFDVMFKNPSWDTISDLIGDLDPDYEPGTLGYQEVEDYAHNLWGRARVVFDVESH